MIPAEASNGFRLKAFNLAAVGANAENGSGVTIVSSFSLPNVGYGLMSTMMKIAAKQEAAKREAAKPKAAQPETGKQEPAKVENK